MKMLTVGPGIDEAKQFAAEMKKAERSLGASADLALVYLPGDQSPKPYLDALGSSLSVPLCGALTGGAAFTERGYSADGAVGAVLSTGGAKMVLIDGLDSNPKEAISAGIANANLHHGRYSSVMVLAGGLSLDGEMLVEAVRSNLPTHVRVFGGTAGDQWKFEETLVLHNKQSLSNAVVLVALNPESRLSVNTLHGWHAAAEAKELVVTQIEMNVLRTLNDRPAAEVYQEEVKRLGYWDGIEPIGPFAAKFELGATSPFGEKLRIRAPFAFNEDGSIVLAASLRRGEVLRVVETSGDDLIAAAAALSDSATRELGASPGGKLVFDCAARKQLLGDRYGDQVSAFGGDGRHPVLGFACYGEISKSGAMLEGFHNTTAVMASWG